MRSFYQQNKHLIDRLLFFVMITVAVYAFFTVLFDYLSPFFFGLIIALIMDPVIRFFVQRFRMKRWVASLLCLLLFFGGISSLGVWLVITLVRQGGALVESVPFHVEDFLYQLDNANNWLRYWSTLLPGNWEIPDIQEMALVIATAVVGDGMRNQGWQIAATVPNFFINIILTLVSAYFFMSDRENIFKFIRNACPEWLAGQFRRTRKGLTRAMAGYFRAQYILMTMVGIISVIGLLVLRNPYALLIGLLLAILDFLPIIGTGAVFVPWILISFMMGNYYQAVGLAITYGVITITRQVLQPKILGDQMGAHPLASLMSIFIGFRIFGILGLIIGPSLLMVFIAIREVEAE